MCYACKRIEEIMTNPHGTVFGTPVLSWAQSEEIQFLEYSPDCEYKEKGEEATAAALALLVLLWKAELER